MGVTDMLVQHIPSSKRATAAKVARDYTGPQDPDIPLVKFMTDAAPRGPLVMHIAKLFPKQVKRGCREERGRGLRRVVWLLGQVNKHRMQEEGVIMLIQLELLFV
jgi:hypothetical protein